MGTLYIAEFAETPIGPAGKAGQTVMQPPLAEQTLTISGTAAQSSPFNKSTRYIRLNCDATCSVLFGANNPEATTSNARMIQNMTEYHAVWPSTGMMVSVIANV